MDFIIFDVNEVCCSKIAIRRKDIIKIYVDDEKDTQIVHRILIDQYEITTLSHSFEEIMEMLK